MDSCTTGELEQGETTPKGTLLDRWKEYTQGEDADTIIQNIYTPHTSSADSVIVAKKEQLPSNESREKLRGLRLKAEAREKETCPASMNSVAPPLPQGENSQSGGTFYAVPNQRVADVNDFSDEEDNHCKRKERWYKRAKDKFFGHRH